MILLCLLFVLSGLAGLMLETVFLRQLAWLFGNSTTATVAVLTAFMAGLAIGATTLGRVVDRRDRPLRFYGWLELGTAISGAGLAWLLGSGRWLFIAPLRDLGDGPLLRAVELLLAFGLMLIPTVLMGGTLPALSRLVVRDLSRFAGSLGWLYAINTLGAAAGVFLAGFWFFERFGVSRTAYIAALLQAAVGLMAIALDRGERWRRPPVEPQPEASPAASAPGGVLPRGVRLACLALAGSAGFVVLGYEVLWSRLLRLYMRSFSYSFSLMLSLFLVGLTIGSASLALVASRIRKPERLLAWLQISSALYVASMPLWITTQLAPIPASSFGEFLARGALRTALLVLPPTIVSGMSLPLAARCFARGEGRVASEVGTVYGVNTLGAILGAPVAGLLLLPWIGAPAALVVLAVCQAVAGLVVFVSIAPRSATVAVAALLTAACALPIGFDRGKFVTAFLEASRNERMGELLFFHEGVTDTVAVVRRDYGFHDPRAKSLITNGVAMSATVKPVWRYMAAEGHLPVLLARTPEKALLVGVGTGITLGAVASHPELQEIDVVELSRGVLDGLEYFEEENEGAFRDPRVRLMHDDGRRYLEMTHESYDLITLEPPPPIVAGSVHLYSLDFYRICVERLRAGGVVAQWLPLHAQSLESARMTATTFLEAFPHVTLWLPSIRDAVLIGSIEPAPLDPRRLDRAFATPRTRHNLERAYLETPEALLGSYFLDRAGIEAWAGEASLITDEHPLMEFFRHQGRTMGDSEIATLLIPKQGRLEAIARLEGREELLGAARLENAALRSYVRSGVERDGRAGEDAIRLSTGTEFYRYRIGCAPRQIEYLRSTPKALPRETLTAHLDRCAAFRRR